MENAIKHLRIQNFKSIKDVTLKPRRVNIIIGEPNVGKSNILEAMSLLGGQWNGPIDKFMGYVLRYENIRQLFYDNLPVAPISIETENDIILFGRSYKNENGNEIRFQYLELPYTVFQAMKLSESFARYGVMVTDPLEARLLNFFPTWYTEQVGSTGSPPLSQQAELTGSGQTADINNYSFRGAGGYGLAHPVKYYTFSKLSSYPNDDPGKSLRTPHGDNLVNVIQTQPELRREIARLYEQHDLKFMVRVDERRLEVIKDLDGIIYSYPYTSTADTLQRIIFYLAAIESNDDAVLLFEEPEAHSFPVYVSKLGRHIVESRNNQFFIVTHSEYLVTEILEEMLTKDEYVGELAIFAAYYEDYQTKVHQLSDQEILDIRADGIDVFYNMERFTTGRENA